MGSQRVGHDWATFTLEDWDPSINVGWNHNKNKIIRAYRGENQDKKSLLQTVMIVFGEENGNPLQYSCLENSMDWGAL